jgi:hypothetical protein
MYRIKNKSAKVAKLKDKQKRIDDLITLENKLFSLVEENKLNDEELKMLTAYKQVYKILVDNGARGFKGKQYKEYMNFRNTLLKKYE